MTVCPFCVGDVAVEVSGLWVHKFPSRWITCNLKNQKSPLEDVVISKPDSGLDRLSQKEESSPSVHGAMLSRGQRGRARELRVLSSETVRALLGPAVSKLVKWRRAKCA
jgi:hypothetical protein